MKDDLERSAVRKVYRHILPLLVGAYFLSYLDRVNIGFAAITMVKDIGLTAKDFGFGAGIFFIGYVLFEVPSNLILNKVGGRVWIARIMVTWGIVSACTAFVWSANSFLVARFLLGVAEAGFFPGIIFYLTFWLPVRARTQVFGFVLAIGVLSVVIGNPVSGWIMSLGTVGGLANWQVLLIAEGVPSILVGFLILAVLPDGPRSVTWLSDEEKDRLTDVLVAERTAKSRSHSERVTDGLLDRKVWILGLMVVPTGAAVYGLFSWLPQIIKEFGLTSVETGFVSAVPFVAAAVAMILWGRHSDIKQERLGHIMAPAAVAGLSLVAAGVVPNGGWSLLAVTIGVAATFSALTVILSTAPSFLAGGAAAAGIALVNSVGNLGSFGGPYMIGWIRDAGGTYQTSLMALGALMFLIIPLALLLRQADTSGAGIDTAPVHLG